MRLERYRRQAAPAGSAADGDRLRTSRHSHIH